MLNNGFCITGWGITPPGAVSFINAQLKNKQNEKQAFINASAACIYGG